MSRVSNSLPRLSSPDPDVQNGSGEEKPTVRISNIQEELAKRILDARGRKSGSGENNPPSGEDLRALEDFFRLPQGAEGSDFPDAVSPLGYETVEFTDVDMARALASKGGSTSCDVAKMPDDSSHRIVKNEAEIACVSPTDTACAGADCAGADCAGADCAGAERSTVQIPEEIVLRALQASSYVDEDETDDDDSVLQSAVAIPVLADPYSLVPLIDKAVENVFLEDAIAKGRLPRVSFGAPKEDVEEIEIDGFGEDDASGDFILRDED